VGNNAKTIQRTFLTLTFMSTLSASLIWGINTLFLLNAGLNNLQAFAANAFFTVGQVIFELPTGMVADAWGRRLSYLLGTVTLMISTLLYLLFWYHTAPFWMWALASMFIGLGFTFFSGATEAWLIDAMKNVNYELDMEHIFAKGQIASGAAMLSGSLAGGVIAQMTSLGIPYLIRSILLVATFMVAFVYMKDIGFIPARPKHPLSEIKNLFRQSIKFGLKTPPVRWLMLSTVFTSGASFYAFYALQPYLLELYGHKTAYAISGAIAALIAGAQIVGGILVPRIRNYFNRRTSILLSSILISSAALFILGFITHFILAVILVGLWALSFAISEPIYLALINELIPTEQRATILSLDNLMGSGGAVVSQPLLGRAADVYGYAVTYVMTAFLTLIAALFLMLTRSLNTNADVIKKEALPKLSG
jgi:MFS family permease